MAERQIQIDHRRLRLRNLDKVLYPAVGFTKAQVIDYYARIAPTMLGHIANRPITLKRYPDGVEGKAFFQKNCPAHRPAWLPTVQLSRTRDPQPTRFCLLNEPAALVWAANLAALEVHAPLHEADAPERPTLIVFDLDPGEPAGFGQCVQVAFELRELLNRLDLDAIAKTSGGKGLHVYAPLPEAVDYDHTKSLARSLARLLTQRYPRTVTDRMSRAERPGKIFVDWSQNTQTKTTVSVYSLRARPEPTVATPMQWSELEPWLKRPRRAPPRFLPADVLQRVQAVGDLAAALRPADHAERHQGGTAG